MSNEYIKANDNFSLALFFNLSHFYITLHLYYKTASLMLQQ